MGNREFMNHLVLEPVRVVRDPGAFTRWWHGLQERDSLLEALECLSTADRGEVEYALNSLMLAVFQESGPIEWLQVVGLRRGVEASYVVMDFDLAYDGEGVLDGVDLVLSVITKRADGIGAPPPSLRVSVYIDHPSLIKPASIEDTSVALAELIDNAIALINDEVAAQDRFISEAREVRSVE